MDKMKDLFTTGEAAEVCRVSQQTIIRCFDAGRLEGFRVPGSRFRRIPRQSLIKFMKDNNIPLDAIESGKRKVLIVDDDAEIVELLVDVLERDGRFETKTASSGYEAGIATEQFRPELVLLDYMLPDVNGNVVCQTIRKNPNFENIRIIIVSGVVKQDEISQLLKSGADDFIHTPFSAELLLAHVCNVLKLNEITQSEPKDDDSDKMSPDSKAHDTLPLLGLESTQYVAMSLTIERDFDSFSQNDEELFLSAIQHLLGSQKGVSLVQKELRSVDTRDPESGLRECNRVSSRPAAQIQRSVSDGLRQGHHLLDMLRRSRESLFREYERV